MFVPSLMSNLSDSGIPEVSSAIEPPPALAMTFCLLLLLLLLDAFVVVVVVAATEASFSRFKWKDESITRLLNSDDVALFLLSCCLFLNVTLFWIRLLDDDEDDDDRAAVLARIIIVWFDVEANIARGVWESLKFTTWSVLNQFLVKSFTSSSSSSSLVKCGIKRLNKKPRLLFFLLSIVCSSRYSLFLFVWRREAAAVGCQTTKKKRWERETFLLHISLSFPLSQKSTSSLSYVSSLCLFLSLSFSLSHFLSPSRRNQGELRLL